VPAVQQQLGFHLELPARVTATNLEFIGHIEYEDWAQAIIRIAQARDRMNWHIGACIVEGENRFGEKYSQGISDAGISPTRAMACKYVYERFPETARIKELDWSHHREIAPLETVEERIEWIDRCYKKGWSVEDLKDELVKAGLRRTRKPSLPEPDPEPESDGAEGSSGPQSCAVCGNPPANIRICPTCMSVASAGLHS